MPMSAFYIFTDRWMLGVAVCQIWIGVDYTASTASILNLFILSLDRYWSVRQPLKYLHRRTKRRALSMIALVWAVSSLWIIPISSWHYFAHSGIRTVPDDTCDTEYAKNSFFKVITAFFNFYLPLTIMYILYFRIFIAIRKRSEFELGQRNPGGTTLSYKSNAPNSLDDSEYNDDLSCSIEQKFAGTGKVSENGTRSHVTSNGKNLRVLTVKRHQDPLSYKDVSSTPYRVEYIYDENVIDPQTEKIERYYYEDHYPMVCLSRPSWMVENERCSITNPRPGFIRSPRQLGDFRMPGRLHTMSSLASSSNGSYVKEQHQFQHKIVVGSKHSALVKRRLFGGQKNSNISVLPAKNNVRLESCKKYESNQVSYTAPFYIEPPNISSSSSSSASTFEDRRGDERGIKTCSDRGINDNPSQTGDTDVLKRIPRGNFSVVGSARKIRQAESFPDRPGGITSCGSMDGSSSRNGDDSDGVLVLRDAKSRRLTSGMISLKERIRTIRQSSSLNKEIKAARQLGVIMGAFTLCFLPYFILFLVVAFCDNCIKPDLLTAATWVGYLNSTLNPFLYPLCNASFRSKFRNMMSCCKRGQVHLRTTQHEFMERNTACNSRYD